MPSAAAGAGSVTDAIAAAAAAMGALSAVSTLNSGADFLTSSQVAAPELSAAELAAEVAGAGSAGLLIAFAACKAAGPQHSSTPHKLQQLQLHAKGASMPTGNYGDCSLATLPPAVTRCFGVSDLKQWEEQEVHLLAEVISEVSGQASHSGVPCDRADVIDWSRRCQLHSCQVWVAEGAHHV